MTVHNRRNFVARSWKLLHIVERLPCRVTPLSWYNCGTKLLQKGRKANSRIFRLLKSISCKSVFYNAGFCSRLPPFWPPKLHVETFTTARRTKTEEVRVICNLVLAFLSTDVYCNRDSLSVGIVYFQRCFFAMLNPFLVHKTCSCITKGQKTVVFRIGGITISREWIDKKLQLIVRLFADVDSQLAEEILQMIGTSLNIRIDRYSCLLYTSPSPRDA